MRFISLDDNYDIFKGESFITFISHRQKQEAVTGHNIFECTNFVLAPPHYAKCMNIPAHTNDITQKYQINIYQKEIGFDSSN